MYNVTPDEHKSALAVISQVGDYCIQITVTLTSVLMRETPSAEELLGKWGGVEGGGGGRERWLF